MAKSEFSRILIFVLLRLAIGPSGLLAEGPGFDQMMCDRNCQELLGSLSQIGPLKESPRRCYGQTTAHLQVRPYRS